MICYNTLIDAAATPTTASDQSTITYGIGAGPAYTNNPNIYVYRNTVIGNLYGADFHVFTTYIENNVIINSDNGYGVTSGTNKIVYATDITTHDDKGNLYGKPSDGFLDQNGNLIGGTASQYRGKVGHVISVGVNPLGSPDWK